MSSLIQFIAAISSVYGAIEFTACESNVIVFVDSSMSVSFNEVDNLLYFLKTFLNFHVIPLDVWNVQKLNIIWLLSEIIAYWKLKLHHLVALEKL